jgi:hypothetical protein
MRIEIKKDIFESNDFKSLNYLVQICTYKGRYDLFVDMSQVSGNILYQKLDEDDKEILENSFNSSIQSSFNSNIYVTTQSNNTNEFNMEEAIRYLIQPVSLILENSLNDAYFIQALVRCFPNTTKIQKHLANNWLQFENAGGCDNIRNFIEGKLQSFNNLSKPNYEYLRCFVLMDSDKKFQNQLLEGSQKITLRDLVRNNIAKHFLRKRCMENYLPDEVFDEINDRNCRNWISIYKTLSSEQKDFLNFSKGFSKKDNDGTPKVARINQSSEVRDLYINLSENDYNTLDDGIQLTSFKDNFPKLFNNTKVTKENLLRRTSHQKRPRELQEILDKITKLL